MRRHLPFYMVVTACLSGLVVFQVMEGRSVASAFRAAAAYGDGVVVLDDPSLTPGTRRLLSSIRFNTAIQYAPPKMNMPRQVIQAYERARMFDAALDVYDVLVANDPSLGMLIAAGNCAYQLGDLDRAEPFFREAIHRYPDDPTAYNALGYMMAELDTRLDEAETLILRALDIVQRRPSPFGARVLLPDVAREEAVYRDSLGWVYYREGRYVEAVEQLESAYRAMPGNIEVRTHLELAKERLAEAAPQSRRGTRDA